MANDYLLKTWREIAYNQEQTQEQYNQVENPIEELEDTTEVSLEYDPEKLYKNMVDAKADWLYNLEEWDNLLTPERRKELYKEQKLSGTVIKEKKVGRNDPCPCGSGKKYKYCCGR